MNLGAAGTTDITDHAPDWAAMTGEILCPLCDYNLRGLVEPRCPECGHQATWPDLLDPTRRAHPWLFEHQNRRRIRAFIKTYFVSLFPHRFWRSVRPHHAPRVGRLVVYWILPLLCMLPVMLYDPITEIGRRYYDVYETRKQAILDYAKLASSPNLTPRQSRWIRIVQLDGGIQKHVESTYGYPSPIDALASYFRMYPLRSKAHASVVSGIILWPWITVASLLVFRSSMRQAKIKSSHVLRCVIYAGDFGLLLAVLMAPLLRWRIDSVLTANSYRSWSAAYTDPVAIGMLLTCVLVLTYYLWFAYRTYLQFPHALATCIASQCMTILTLLLIYSYIAPY